MNCQKCKLPMCIESTDDTGDLLERVYRCDDCKLNCQVFINIDESDTSFGPEWYGDLE